MADAERSARGMGIPFYALKMEADFRENVIDPFIADYQNGLTPNPCVHCNTYIKFGEFYEKATALGFDQIATGHLDRDIALTRGLELGELRIGVGPYGGSALVGPPIGQLNFAHPGLRLKTILAPWQELPDRARARDVDIIVVELSQVQQMEDFAVQGLTEHAMVPVCRPRHPLTLMASPTLADVFGYPVAGPSLTPAFSSLLLDLFPASQRAQQKKRGLLAVECDLSGMLKDVLRHSHAISLMPAFMVAAEVAAGQLVCLPGVELGLRVRFGCAWLKAGTLSPVAARFMELLAEHDRSLATLAVPVP